MVGLEIVYLVEKKRITKLAMTKGVRVFAPPTPRHRSTTIMLSDVSFGAGLSYRVTISNFHKTTILPYY